VVYLHKRLHGDGFSGSTCRESAKLIWQEVYLLTKHNRFIGIGLVAIPLFLQINYPTNSLWSKFKRVDWIGTFLFVASTTSFLIPITWVCLQLKILPNNLEFTDLLKGGVQYPWSSWRTLVPLILGAAGLVGFVFWEKYGAPEPLIRLVIFNNRTAVVTYIGTFIHGMVLWSVLYYLPLYYEAVKHFSPTLSGVAIFPQTFTVAPSAVVVGILITITGHYRWAIWTGWVLTTTGMGLLWLLDVHTSIPAFIFLNLVSGLGTGILFPSMAFAIQASATNADLAFAVAMFSFFRAFGQSVGVAVGGVIFQNTMQKKLMRFPDLVPFAVEYSRDASSLVQVINAMPSSNPMRAEIVQSYADSLKIVWISMCGFAAVALFLSIFTKGIDLNRELETEQGFKHENKRDSKDVEAHA
jgi:Major Facilitator Superfamily